MRDRRISVAAAVLLLALLAIPFSTAAQSLTGLPGPASGVYPTQAIPVPSTPATRAAALAAMQALEANEKQEREHGSSIPKAEMQKLKALGATLLPTGGKEIHLDTTPSPLAPNTGTNFNGLGENGWIPYDAAIAAGPNHIVVMTNAQWAVYDRNGNQLSINQFATWWGTPAGTPFDPKCFYDPVAGRFVIQAVSASASAGKAFMHISVSQTGDPTGAWFSYQLDATKDGTTSSSNWSDYPGLGYDGVALYVTTNQFTLSSNLFQYARIRVIDKSKLYAGNPATYVDFTGMKNADNSLAFTLKAARQLSSGTSQYLINTNDGGANYLTLWRIDNSPTSPTLTRQATLTVGAYSVPPDAPQPGTSTLIATGDSRTQDTVWTNGILHTALGESVGGVGAIRYDRIDTTNNTVLKDITFTQASTHYYYPAVTVDSANNDYFVFSRSSSTEFASVYQTGMTPADTVIEPSALVKSGVASNTSGRWGDYSGIANDPANNLQVVIYAGWANSGNLWATRVANATFSGSPPVPTLTSINPNNGTQGNSNLPVTLTGTNFISGASINFGGAGVTISNTTVVNGTTITATFAIAANAATGPQNVSVTTAGGTSGNVTFTVNAAPPPAPTLSSISPTNGTQGNSNLPVTLTGTNFIAGASINFGGAGVTISNTTVVNGTTITATFAIAANATTGAQNVSVTTAGGTSGNVTFTVNAAPPPAPTLSSISPTSGTQGNSNLPVTLTGTNFIAGATINFSGAGVTISNTTVVNSTTITATFAIAANATTGAQNVSVTTAGGTSGNVTFTVNAAPPPAPTLSTISPNNGTQGNNNLPVTLTGTNFVAGATINFGGAGVTISNTTVVNSTTITATFAIAANAATGAQNVSVTTAGGTSGNVTFTVNAAPPSAPTLASINPTSGVAGTSVNVTLTGTNFIAGQTTIQSSAQAITVTNITVVSSAQITATFNIAADAIKTNAQVTVTTPNGTSGGVNFDIFHTPTLSSIVQNNGNLGAVVNVTLTGTFFRAPITVALSGTGITVSNTVVQSATQITATFAIASNAPGGPQNVTVSNPGGTSGSVPFTVNAAPPPAPTLTSISPNSGAQGNSNLPVTLTGTNFIAGASINFGGAGVTISNTTVVNSTTITATFAIAANAATGAQNVSVTTAGGTSGNVTFTVNAAPPPAPTLSTISPNNGTQGNNNLPVTLTGTNFIAGATINFSGAGLTISNTTVVNSITITATFAIAANATTGAQIVSVTTAGGTSGNVTFTVNPPVPTLASITPTNGTQGNNNLPVTLTGSNFVSGAAINFGGAGVTISNTTVVNSTTITATFAIAANAATGAQNVSVTTAGGTSGNVTFTVNAAPPSAPTLASINPTSGVAGTSVNVTLTGTNFIAGQTTIQSSAQAIAVTNITVVSSAQITATFNIAADAIKTNAQVTVTTPNGTSGGVNFDIFHTPTLSSIVQNNGNLGAVVNVTLTGTFFRAPITVALSGTGITVSNTVVQSATQITATVTIASNAPSGPQNVTVSNPGGTSNAVTFTVN